MTRTNIFGKTLDELREEFRSIGLERFRAVQVFFWLYNRGAESFDEMTNLPKTLRKELASHFDVAHPQMEIEQESEDGTRKFLFALNDERKIESVLIPSESADDAAPKRLTLCISTQVGCPLNCAFCATASMKLKRNLTVGEILGQYIAVRKRSPKRITNLVYMGMGEPMLNYDATMDSIDLITHETTCGVGAQHITVSTAGVVDGIRRMADEGRKGKLAISLHATTDEFRNKLMPINRKHPLQELVGAAEYYYRKTRRRVTYEYILFDGLNDTLEDARRLAKLCKRVPSKVNIIPFHSIASAFPEGLPMDLRPSPADRIERFAKHLREQNITVMLRSSSGQDIDAACGQLAVKQDHSRHFSPKKRIETSGALVDVESKSLP